MKDKRRGARLEVNREFGSFGEFLREYAMNLSEHGVFVHTSELVPVGTAVQLRFTVIAEDVEIIEGEGEVMRVVPTDRPGGPGLAVAFTALTPKSRDTLARLFIKRP